MRTTLQVLTVIALAVLAGAGWHLYGAEAGDDGGSRDQGGQQRSPAVEVAIAMTGQVSKAVGAVGTVRAREAVDIVAEVSGRVASIEFEENSRVEEGDILVSLSSIREEADLREAIAVRDDARRQFERAERLQESGAVSQSDYDEMRAAVESAEARVSAVQARIEEKRIRAPFDGVLGLREVSRGAYVDAGTVLTTLDDISVVRLDFSLPERFLDRLRIGLPVAAHSTVLEGRPLLGEIARIDSRVDAETRTLRVQAEFDNRFGHLRPGQFLTVQVFLETRENAILVPEVALVYEGEDIFLFRVIENEHGKVAERVDVELGVRRDDRIEIRKGVAAGDWVVEAGIQSVSDGQTVRVLNESEVLGTRERGRKPHAIAHDHTDRSAGQAPRRPAVRLD